MTKIPIACTLPASQTADRVAAWREVVGLAIGPPSRTETRDGVSMALRLPSNPDVVARVAALAAAEQACCAFFAFTIHLADGSATLAVSAPTDGAPVLDALFA